MSDHLLVMSTWLSLGTDHSTLLSKLVLSWRPPMRGKTPLLQRANLSPPLYLPCTV